MQPGLSTSIWPLLRSVRLFFTEACVVFGLLIDWWVRLSVHTSRAHAVGRRPLMRRTGLSQHTLEKIEGGYAIRPRTFHALMDALQSHDPAKRINRGKIDRRFRRRSRRTTD